MIIDPFELLGVDINTELKDVKKSYYNLSLLLHPDRGGSKEEMCILQASYNWIKEQLILVENRDVKTFEEYFNEFNINDLSTFTDIHDDCVFDNKLFNVVFETNSNNSELLKDKGYSEEDCIIHDDNPNNPVDNIVINYESNEAVVENYCYIENNIENENDKKKDYSADKPMQMSDYLNAYSDNNIDKIEQGKLKQNKTMESILAERDDVLSEEYYNMSKNNKTLESIRNGSTNDELFIDDYLKQRFELSNSIKTPIYTPTNELWNT